MCSTLCTRWRCLVTSDNPLNKYAGDARSVPSVYTGSSEANKFPYDFVDSNIGVFKYNNNISKIPLLFISTLRERNRLVTELFPVHNICMIGIIVLNTSEICIF